MRREISVNRRQGEVRLRPPSPVRVSGERGAPDYIFVTLYREGVFLGVGYCCGGGGTVWLCKISFFVIRLCLADVSFRGKLTPRCGASTQERIKKGLNGIHEE